MYIELPISNNKDKQTTSNYRVSRSLLQPLKNAQKHFFYS